jgi:hypothetical protein
MIYHAGCAQRISRKKRSVTSRLVNNQVYHRIVGTEPQTFKERLLARLKRDGKLR